MRYGVLADIHGNLQALRAALEEVQPCEVDGWLVAGDLVGYGPHPNECVELVAGLGGICVAGNHDLIALGRLSDERCIPMARHSLRWTRGVLGEAARAYLASLPPRATAPGGVELAHGSIDDPEDYTVTPPQARAQLSRLDANGARVLVLGHTHRPWAFTPGGGTALGGRPLGGRGAWALRGHGMVPLPEHEPLLLNPGAVGQSRELRARARAVVLDLEGRRASFLDPRYDVAACRDALRRAGLSPRSYHLLPSPVGVGRAALRAVSRRARPRDAG
jgi:predicted phosphodiesterase